MKLSLLEVQEDVLSYTDRITKPKRKEKARLEQEFKAPKRKPYKREKFNWC